MLLNRIDGVSWGEDDWDLEDLHGNDERTIRRHHDWCNINEMESISGKFVRGTNSEKAGAESVQKK